MCTQVAAQYSWRVRKKRHSAVLLKVLEVVEAQGHTHFSSHKGTRYKGDNPQLFPNKLSTDAPTSTPKRAKPQTLAPALLQVHEHREKAH